jgi:predicted PolB exonuclease-like 3'-5' exonuclease
MTCVYLDIETIPAQTDAAKQLIASSVKAPGNLKKADSIAAWEKEQRPTAVEEAISKSGLNGAFGHICSIGFAFDNAPASSMSWPLDFGSERELLAGFSERMEQLNFSPVVVGHNVANFDIRFMWQRAMVLGVRMPVWFPRNPKPWSIEVFDTMAAWSGPKDFIGMNNLCAALGLPGKDDIDGSMVGDLWAKGEFEKIDAYCRSDVERTRAIHRRMKVALGESQDAAA